MRAVRGRCLDVVSDAELAERLDQGAESIAGWRLHDLDLTGYAGRFAGLDVAGGTFVDCRIPEDLDADLRARGALVVRGAPTPARADDRLYSPADLYDALLAGRPYAETYDARVFAWSHEETSSEAGPALDRALHDHTIDRALEAWVADRHLVGVMGGHALRRGEPAYTEATRLGHALAERHTVATGGGPGAMEAANLGAWLTDPDTLDPALAVLASEPAFRPDLDRWATTAFEVRERWPAGRESLGVPTWFYGHEPPNVFATAIAKYFRNATREAILLQVCDRGIVFLPGAAGTVQEIFQDGCENYYADESALAPMVLLGARYWRDELPVWPLLQRLAAGRPMFEHVHLVDSVDKAAALLAPG